MALLADDLVDTELGDQGKHPDVAFDSWKDAVRRGVLKFHFDCERPRAFKGAISNRSLAGVNFINMKCERHAAYRDRDTIFPAEAPYYLMTLQISGELRLSQDDRNAVLKPGSFAIYDSSKPATLVSSDDYKSMCIRFPKEHIGPRCSDPLAGITATAFECRTGLPSTVWGMLLSLNRNLEFLGHNGRPAVRNVMELVAAMLRTELGQNELECPPRREVLLQNVYEYIDSHLPDPELDPSSIAAAHYISPRYLHGLFEGTNFTVSAWIRARRIELCRRDLADPQMVDVPATAIAARRGFKGASHFGQVFKRETGLTPAEFRREATAGLR